MKENSLEYQNEDLKSEMVQAEENRIQTEM